MHRTYQRLARLPAADAARPAAVVAPCRLLYGAHEVLVVMPVVVGATECTDDDLLSYGAPAQVAQNDTLFAYPKDGQSAEQQASDRYDCHKWALEQTGYDPTQSGGGVPSEEAGQRRADYQRAMTSCLEGRGYSVR
jgi:hypothetical protein